MFNYLALLTQHAVPHVLGPAPNIRRGHVGLRCPFCGPGDPGMHMSINLVNGKWGCWRDPTHRGASAVRLVCALLGVSGDKARELVGDPLFTDALTLDQMVERAKTINQGPPPRRRPKVIPFPPEFKRIDPSGLRQRFWEYLVTEPPRGRGFRPKDVPVLCGEYLLRCCLVGRFRERVVLPVTDRGGVYGWTARTIHRDVEARYLAHPDGDQIKQHLFNQDPASGGGDTLMVVEGPFDALKLDLYGRGLGVRAVALMGTAATDAQVARLLRMGQRFARVVVMLDQGALAQALVLSSRLAHLGAQVWPMPDGSKDAGDLSRGAIREFLRTRD